MNAKPLKRVFDVVGPQCGALNNAKRHEMGEQRIKQNTKKKKNKIMIYAIIKCQFIWASSCVPFPSVPPSLSSVRSVPSASLAVDSTEL